MLMNLCCRGRYAGAETEYEATVEFYADVKTDYRKIDSDRHLELVLNKEAAGWWPRLLKAQGKVSRHYVAISSFWFIRVATIRTRYEKRML